MILLAPVLSSRSSHGSPRSADRACDWHFGTLPAIAACLGSALAAISVGVLIAVIVSLAAASRYGNVLDYAGPNLSSNQLALSAYTPPPAGTIIVGPDGKHHRCEGALVAGGEPGRTQRRASERIASALGAQAIALESPSASASTWHGTGPGRTWNGQIYVATPQLLGAFGISQSEIQPDADILTARPGLSGVSGLSLTHGGNSNGNGGYGDRGRQRQRTGKWSWQRSALLSSHGLPRQPGHPGSERPPRGRIGAEHRDHRARDARVPYPVEHLQLADPGNAAVHRCADQWRSASGFHRTVVRRVEE